ncbi:MAG: CHAT domain-containing protein, partial [Saprospiraceae bacterium]|nr:CHAT domain-containing protein [Saprospiraceae bacterium]
QVLFTSVLGERRVFRFIDENLPIFLHKDTCQVNVLQLNYDNMLWMGKQEMQSIQILNKKTKIIRSYRLEDEERALLRGVVSCLMNKLDRLDVTDVELDTDTEFFDQLIQEKQTRNTSEQLITNPKNRTDQKIAIVDQLSARLAGIDRPTYAKNLSQIAEMYKNIGDSAKAEAYYKEAEQNIQLFSGLDYDGYPKALHNLGLFYQSEKNYVLAEQYFRDALQLTQQIRGQTDIDYLQTLQLLGQLYTEEGKFEEAAAELNLLEQVMEEYYTPNHPQLVTTLSSLSNLYRLSGDDKKARQYLLELAHSLIQQLYSYYPSLNETERTQFLQKIQDILSSFYSAAFELGGEEMSNEIIQLNLSIKGLALEGSIATRANILSKGDSTLREKYYNWLGIRRQLAQTALMSKTELELMGINLKELEQTGYKLEGELSKASALLAQQFKQKSTQYSLKQLQGKLAQNQVAIDFMHFQYHNGKELTDTTVYYANLIFGDTNQAPQLIYLGQERRLATLLSRNANYVSNTKLSKEVFAFVWKPLLSHLEGKEKVYVSPSGLLHQVSFAALKDEQGKYIIDQFDLEYWGSFRDLIYGKKEKKLASKQEIALLGGAKFDLDSTQLADIAEKIKQHKNLDVEDLYAYVDLAIPFRRALLNSPQTRYFNFSYLIGTKTEIETITELFKKNVWKTYPYLGENALEENFKQHTAKQAPSILHIATHGYFFRPYQTGSQKSKEKAFYERILYAQNPLLRSGFVLTGANHSWQGKTKIKDLEDGIVTAYEVSNLDLFATDMVVLSACETGLGDIQASEGVLGLQRAFRSAGVEHLLVSLWKIPDQETAVFMEVFYKYYLTGNDAQQALIKTQRKLRKKHSAYMWAGFVLLN